MNSVIDCLAVNLTEKNLYSVLYTYTTKKLKFYLERPQIFEFFLKYVFSRITFFKKGQDHQHLF